MKQKPQRYDQKARTFAPCLNNWTQAALSWSWPAKLDKVPKLPRPRIENSQLQRKEIAFQATSFRLPGGRRRQGGHTDANSSRTSPRLQLHPVFGVDCTRPCRVISVLLSHANIWKPSEFEHWKTRINTRINNFSFFI